jgi:hypothetical protein
MGFHIAVWPFDVPIDSRRAKEIHLKLLQGDLSGVQPSENIDKFVQDVTSVFPIPRPDQGRLDENPWAAPFNRSDRHVIMAVVMDKLLTVANVVLSLARKHRLVCFLPAHPTVYLPDDDPGEFIPQTNEELFDYVEKMVPEANEVLDLLRWDERSKKGRFGSRDE